VEFGAAFWVQRTDWPSLRTAALAAEAAGFDALWVDDHLLNDEGDADAPKLEAWTLLAALAEVTSRATIGPLVGANTLRNPGLLAKMAATVDEVSNGRLVLGLGAGWFEREHDAFGFEFGASAGERIDRLGEALPLLRRLLDGHRVTHDGRWYRLHDAVCSPVPRHRVPLLVGGRGRRRTLPLVARTADAWNTYAAPEEYTERAAVLDAACREIGRDPRSIHRSVNVNVVVRRSPDDARAAFRAVLDRHDPQPGEEALDAAGPPEDIARLVAAYAALGVDQVIWIFRSPWDLETIAALPAVRRAVGEEAGRDRRAGRGEALPRS
jgi:F420-dependent oxidoreductase-like protein